MTPVKGIAAGPHADFGALPPDDVLFGLSEAMNAVRQRAERVARANVPVVIQGESGTGKEVLAHFIHRRSPWSDGPFVKVNCPAIPETLVESELFGYEKGAFTGAYGPKAGRVELAHRGFLFLDEIAESDPATQAKLLQVLQDGIVHRIGGREGRRVEFRVIYATKHRLQEEVAAGNFRADLFYRINVVSLELLPLRSRRPDIPAVVGYLIHKYNQHYGCQAPPLAGHLLHLLQSYDWPGNIRELENLIRRYVILGSEQVIRDALPKIQPFSLPASGGVSIPLKKVARQAVHQLEHQLILSTLKAHNWNRKEAARALNISYRSLLYKIKEAGVPRKRISLAQQAFGVASEEVTGGQGVSPQ